MEVFNELVGMLGYFSFGKVDGVHGCARVTGFRLWRKRGRDGRDASGNTRRRAEGFGSFHYACIEGGGLLVFPNTVHAVPNPQRNVARLILPNSGGEALCVGDASALADASGERFTITLRSLSRPAKRCGLTPLEGAVAICGG